MRHLLSEYLGKRFKQVLPSRTVDLWSLNWWSESLSSLILWLVTLLASLQNPSLDSPSVWQTHKQIHADQWQPKMSSSSVPVRSSITFTFQPSGLVVTEVSGIHVSGARPPNWSLQSQSCHVKDVYCWTLLRSEKKWKKSPLWFHSFHFCFSFIFYS